ncbi:MULTISPECIES: ComEA family DNA-binding protein [Pseudomonas]|uniref:ComEA family DNA-binding protein n=1 Tax=Pseudomonas piscis TaxID=2614538 RepID=A0ABY9NCA5_9PSED|nr:MULTISPECIES: ComEA family DNA-binding protein [Pseudomonas]POA55740.1 competence protein ComEA [Pseudomonas sp. FW507-12TSA]WMN16065.1 ComEA family DNA-binding protein [Pseudomonas piscis]
MRIPYFSSLFFAALASFSLATQAAPIAKVQEAATEVVEHSTSNSTRLDINTADATLLQRELLGIGEAKARAIVSYREANGPFASVDELLEVKGIGKAILERNRDKLQVN